MSRQATAGFLKKLLGVSDKTCLNDKKIEFFVQQFL